MDLYLNPQGIRGFHCLNQKELSDGSHNRIVPSFTHQKMTRVFKKWILRFTCRECCAMRFQCIWGSTKYVGVTFLGKNGLSFHINVVLLKVEREIWKSMDLSQICGFWCRFYRFCRFSEKNWCFPLGSSLWNENWLSVLLVLSQNLWNSHLHLQIFPKSADFTDFAIMRFKPLIK